MKKTLLVFVIAAAVVMGIGVTSSYSQSNTIYIPDIPGYKTLKCDFHMHTVFSDGSVWPTIRVQEAFREGLDVISITDHYEYLPHKQDMQIDFSRPYEIARPQAELLNILLVPGGEITRAEPQGHHNAIFLTDIGAVDVPDSIEAIRVAASQGAFIFSNHPGWKRPDRKGVWEAVQDTIYNAGLMHGVEVVNGHNYDPNAHAWSIEKGLTMMGNSDVHTIVSEEYTNGPDGHRPMTLVFAKEKTLPAVKDALENRRTAVYWRDNLAGDKKYLEPIFNNSAEVVTPEITVTAKGRSVVLVKNTSDIPFNLRLADTFNAADRGLSVPGSVTVPAHQTATLQVRGISRDTSGVKVFRLPYVVTNFLIAPDEGLPVELPVTVTFIHDPVQPVAGE